MQLLYTLPLTCTRVYADVYFRTEFEQKNNYIKTLKNVDYSEINFIFIVSGANYYKCADHYCMRREK